MYEDDEYEELWEDGDEFNEETIVFYQDAINTGMAWKMEGSFGRFAMDLIEGGYCMLGEIGHRDYWGTYIPSRFEVEPGTKGSEGYMQKMQDSRF